MENKVKENQTNWQNLLIFITIHALALTAIFSFTWTNFIVAFILLWFSVGWGIGIGYHRLLTHRSFESPKWFEYLLAILGSLTLQKGAISWVTTHRIHHAFTEKEEDPHSPDKGFFWSHTGWMLFGISQNYSIEVCQKYSRDLLQDKFYFHFERINLVPAIIVAILLYCLGGWGMLAWGVGVRTVISWHITWGINSFAHKFGSQRFKTGENSRNNAVLGILAFGEGWHNNHHAFPTSARHGLVWYELDLSYLQIKLFEKLGIVKNVKVPTQKSIEKRQLEFQNIERG
ncbi:MAG: fatty acid desaturase [Pyrinomonadaceae bacterium]|nr:fatty acid desaturase [Pyrinomonadaceae bacterium]